MLLTGQKKRTREKFTLSVLFFNPMEIYGLGVVAVDNEQELKKFIANDPAGKINKYEYFPMKAVVPNISIG